MENMIVICITLLIANIIISIYSIIMLENIKGSLDTLHSELSNARSAIISNIIELDKRLWKLKGWL